MPPCYSACMLRLSSATTAPRSLNLAPVRAALFDLDGTLIDVDMQQFVPAYLRRLAGRLAAYADPQRTVGTLHAAVMNMLDGTAGECSLEGLLRTMLAEQLQLDWPDYQAGWPPSAGRTSMSCVAGQTAPAGPDPGGVLPGARLASGIGNQSDLSARRDRSPPDLGWPERSAVPPGDQL